MGKRIREVMTPSPETVEPGQPVAEAAKLMKQADVGMIPVVQEGQLSGTVTDRDIVLRVIAEGKSPASTTVGEIASGEVVTVDPEQELEEAL